MTCKLLAEVCEGSPELWLGEAAGYLRRSIAQSTPDQSQSAQGVRDPGFRSRCCWGTSTGHSKNAGRAGHCSRSTSSCAFSKGGCCTTWDDWRKPAARICRVLTEEDEWHLSSIDRDLTGFKVRQNLASVAASMGDLAEAERQWFEVVRPCAGPSLGMANAGRHADRATKVRRRGQAGTIK